MPPNSTPLLRSHRRHRLPAALLAFAVTVGIMTGCAGGSPRELASSRGYQAIVDLIDGALAH